MPQLLLEFFCEEIPARMQIQAERDLARLLSDKLSAAGLSRYMVQTFSGPRRLAAVVNGLPAELAARIEEKKGPRLGAPQAALDGFVKSAGISSLAEAQIVEDKKGAFYVARMHQAGCHTRDVLAQILPQIIREFPWPKSMRWGKGELTWVRPLHSILCAFDGQLVPFEIEGIKSGLQTRGHRFHAPAAFEARDFDAYRDKLRAAFVLIDREERKSEIHVQARGLMAARGLEWVQDEGLLDEVAGLCEWPRVLIGEMDPAFLELPAEVIRLTMRTHQRYFALYDPKRDGLSPHFLAVANIAASDGGAAIAAGNSRVLSARLSDARFFWEADQARPLDSLLPRLDRIVFHEKLGSVGAKAARVERLARELAQELFPEIVEQAALAAKLAKADLVTETVGEFPELQGQVGAWLHLRQGGDARIAQAIADHYRPVGPSDQVPKDPISLCAALADKLDTLAGFFAIDERPTGSKDPYALRRAALGVVRIILENGLRLPFSAILARPLARIIREIHTETEGAHERALSSVPSVSEAAKEALQNDFRQRHFDLGLSDDEWITTTSRYIGLIAFLFDRLKVQLRDQGMRHDVIEAVFALGGDDLAIAAARVDALSAFLTTEDGANLLAGYRRAGNIVGQSSGDGAPVRADHAIHPALFQLPEESNLHGALMAARARLDQAVTAEDLGGAMAALASLRAPVDAFLDRVFVNDPDLAVRANRLALLAGIKDLMEKIANFGKIEG